MALAPGTRLGPYAIVGALGAGGMGEVYKARDTRLDRDVALKVLPPHLAADLEALARFEREAKAVAALSHPNILAIHDFEGEGGTAYAVTELLEGESLRARLAACLLPLKKALQIATEIAQGLAAAQQKHIVHRDLKPDNVFVAADGRLKILDFGLARHIAPLVGDASDSPTELQRTDPGVVMGTVGYMSPEQVRGQSVDERSDIFSRGCVLFEMVTASRRPAMITLAAAGLLLAGAAFLAGRYVAQAGRVTGGPTVVSFQRITDSPGVETSPTISPDGRTVVYATGAPGSSHLYSVHVGSRTAPALTVDPLFNDSEPAFSPESERIAFRSERDPGGIFVMTATGESVKRITDFGHNPEWSPDGREIVVSNGGFVSPTERGTKANGLSVVDVATRRRRVVLSASDAMQPSWSPHGTRIAYWGLRGGGGQRDLWTVAADGSEAATGGMPVTDDPAVDWSPMWSPDGTYLYFSSTRGGTMNLWRVPIDEGSGRTRGAAEPVTTPSSWSGYYSISKDGTKLAYASLDWRSTLVKVAFDSARGAVVGPAEPVLTGTRTTRDHEVSPNGQWVVFTETGAQEDVIVARIDGAQYTRLTDDAFRNRSPVWSGNGERILFYSDRSGSYQLWTIQPDSTGMTLLPTPQIDVNFPAWARDGRVAFTQIPTAGAPGGWYILRPGESGGTPELQQPIDATTLFWALAWSPDGMRVAGSVSRPSGGGLGVFTLASRRYATLPNEPSSSIRAMAWLSDGRRLIVRDARGIWIVHPDTQDRRQLITVGGSFIGRSVGVTRDDKWITYTETGTEGDIWIATLKK